MHSGSGPSRNPSVGPAGRAGSSSSAAASPSESSSGFEQQQQQQQSGARQFTQQLVRKPEGNEAAMLAYQAGGLQGLMAGGNFGGSNRGQVGDQHGQPNPIQQAYLQYAFQAAHQKSALAMQAAQHQAKMGMVGAASGRDQDVRMGNLMQAANQGQASSSKTSSGGRGEKQIEQSGSDQRNETKPPTPQDNSGQFPTASFRPMQMTQPQQGIQNLANSHQLAMAAQLQAMQAWAMERNIDLSHPANANLMAQMIPIMQSRMAAQQKANENNMNAQSATLQVSRQQVTSPPSARDNSPHANSASDVSGQSGSAKARQTPSAGPFASTPNAGLPAVGNTSNTVAAQNFSMHGRENQLPSRTAAIGNGMPSMHPPQSSVSMSHLADQSLHIKHSSSGPETLQMQQLRQINKSSPQSNSPAGERASNNHFTQQSGTSMQMTQNHLGFTKQQLHVLKAQILAFRRLKKGEGTLPQELLQAITPPSLEQQQQGILPGRASNQEKSAGKAVQMESTEKDTNAMASHKQDFAKEEIFTRVEKANFPTGHVQGMPVTMKESTSGVSMLKEEQPVRPDEEVERVSQMTNIRSDVPVDKGKAIAPESAAPDADQTKKPVQANSVPHTKDTGPAKKYHGPLFDFPFFTRKHDSFVSATTVNSNNTLTLAYDMKDLLFEEGIEALKKKRSENLEKIGNLLAVNLEKKRIRPDLVLRLQIEEKKIRLLDLQARLRDEVDQQQQEIMAMPERPYKKFVKLCERQRLELARQVQASQKASREKQLKSIFQWRKKLLEAHWAIRDARTARNRGVAKYHERMLREYSKNKDDDRNKRMEALKNNDVERYREMLLEQQISIPGDAAERYTVLSSFLTQTEEYLHKLGSKITAAKNQQEVEEAAAAAAASARLQGFSEEEVRAAAACAGEEVMIRNQFLEMNAPKDNSSVSKYYNLAHAVTEKVIRQPSMLRAGTLRDYQLVGLQWMLSLYNNKLNGILADEMGLGKTVQVMALIAYLMEYKGNYGPHLIIVPNAVLVNWKSEFYNWLPSVSCIFYVGAKEQRSKLFSQEVCAMKFNVLVTTYEFIMYDRSKLSRIDWKYIIIDEAQRMKDRESVLARDLDRYRCQRRLLLTGTPLQNDLKELWSLLNLLLPEVFDNRKAFHDWFSKPFQKEGPTHNAEDDWLETEKKVIIIHRLHQILEPFMLRRRVEDVEGSLPPKISIVLKCRMSGIQSAIYDWVKSTGTIRVDPEDNRRRVQKSQIYQPKVYRTLNNRCMELRKACNHPLLNYPYFQDFSKEFLVKSCGKLWILDRILIKLQRTGHRVLLFSTMTKLLDIMEEYLQWRRLAYRRIDGTTSLEDRESAIVEFNSPGSDCFIFLLSIRAAGRGLNLQSADTVIIYDPDPNPKNEEQAVARAHRIGQTREVKVIYMEAVVDKISSHQKEDELRSGGTGDYEDDFAGKDRYVGSIESLIRNNIQQYKIDMADEVINAGRFDQRTTHEERRMTLETLLHDEERYQETVHDVPSLQEVNRMIARSQEEVKLFDQMDEELDWTGEMTSHEQVPKWLRAGTREVDSTVAQLSKKPAKSSLYVGVGMESGQMGSDLSPKAEKRRGRPKGKNHPNYKELDDEDEEYSEASSDERNGDSAHEEDGEVGELEDDELSGAAGAPTIVKDKMEEDATTIAGDYEYPRIAEQARNSHIVEEGGSSGSSSDSQRLTRTMSPSASSQKFGSLSAIDARPSSLSNRLLDELEEGEIAVSGDSHMDHQQSGSWTQERDEGEDEQVLQPRIKRKRSFRNRPRLAVEIQEEKPRNEILSLQRKESSALPSHLDRKHHAQLRNDVETKMLVGTTIKNDQSIKNKRSLPSRKIANKSKLHASPKSGRSNYMPVPSDASEHTRESWDGKVNSSGTSKFGTTMLDTTQRKCKSVISKLQRKIDKEGPQIVPLLTDLWKKVEQSNMGGAGTGLLDFRKVDLRIERLEYSDVMDVVLDVQLVLKSAMQFYGFSHEVRSEARKVHDLFFDILKLAFPDTDFREVRNALSFSGSVPNSAPTPSSRKATAQSKKHKQRMNEIEPDTSHSQKLQRGPITSGERTRVRVRMPQKEKKIRNTGSSRELCQQDNSALTHPGELVVCKKKRKEREKSAGKVRTGSNGPVSPPVIGRGIQSPGPGSAPKETRLADAGGGLVGWANPVKRLRTDAARRRQSHL